MHFASRPPAPEHASGVCGAEDLYRHGARYRLHRKDLPGSPDLVFGPRKLAIFVHGCFWHRHAGCKLAWTPKSRVEFWNEKFANNHARDRTASQALRRSGWRVEVIWECETREKEHLANRIGQVLADAGRRKGSVK